jgi:hypothetical protein
MHTQLTPVSANAKTGPIPVSTTTRDSCPTSCALRNNGCYAETGPLNFHWKKVTAGERGTDFDTFCAAIKALPPGQVWRHNQAGDLPGEGDRIARGLLTRLVRANRGRRGFTYTHKPVLGASKLAAENRHAVSKAVEDGFTINLSGNNLAHADRLADLNIAPVVVVLPRTDAKILKTPAGRTVTVCPATYSDDISCASCQLCQRTNRASIVGFPVHGTGANKAAKVAHAA